MQTQAKFRFRKATTPPTRHPGSDPARAPRLLAAAGAVFFTALGMATLVSNAPAAPAHHASVGATTAHSINGIPVFDLPSVNVHASVKPVIAGTDVASDGQPVSYSGALLRRVSGDADPIMAVGSQLSMPYYSFGAQLGHISKD